ncbi:MAG: hypothetical protein IKY78_06290 [Clostridia bacterium]|nr:hypothetical protein [Clostridia bacterium]
MMSFFKKVLSVLLACFLFYCVIFGIVSGDPFILGIAVLFIVIVICLIKRLKKTAAKKRNQKAEDGIDKVKTGHTKKKKDKKRKSKKTDVSATYCKKCNKEVIRSNIYCFNCGHKID